MNSNTLTKFLGQNWSKVVFAGLVLLIAYPAYKDWSKQHTIEVAAREEKEAIDRIGTDASVTGAMYWTAYKACSRIGIPNVEQCAKYEGTLLQEKAAPILATTAVDQRMSYDKSCIKLFTQDSCYNLLNRAYILSRNEP